MLEGDRVSRSVSCHIEMQPDPVPTVSPGTACYYGSWVLAISLVPQLHARLSRICQFEGLLNPQDVFGLDITVPSALVNYWRTLALGENMEAYTWYS